jgi:hypothetical protein
MAEPCGRESPRPGAAFAALPNDVTKLSGRTSM